MPYYSWVDWRVRRVRPRCSIAEGWKWSSSNTILASRQPNDRLARTGKDEKTKTQVRGDGYPYHPSLRMPRRSICTLVRHPCRKPLVHAKRTRETSVVSTMLRPPSMIRRKEPCTKHCAAVLLHCLHHRGPSMETRELESKRIFFTRFQPYPRTACVIQAMKPDQVQNNTTTTTEDVQPSIKTPQITSSPVMQVTEQEDHTLAPVCRPSRTTTADATTPSLLPLCLRSPSRQVVEFLSIGEHSQET